MKILYEDNHLLILHKPASLVTQPCDDHQDSLEQRAKAYIKEKYQKKGEVFLHAIHRLDKEVEGIVIFAKTSKALSRMNEMLREKKVKKIYQARVEGAFFDEEGCLEHSIMKKERHSSVTIKSEKGKKGTLSYKLLERSSKTSLLEICLLTGRYHQIRAQLSFVGHPILGDTKYGSVQSYEKGAIALKHVYCSFIHPTKNVLVEIQIK